MLAQLKAQLYDRNGALKIGILRSPLFLSVLGLKLAAAFLFASDYLTKLFVPFVNYYVTSGFLDPYLFFHGISLDTSFPYPTVMLWALALPRLLLSPFLSADFSVVTFGHVFALRLVTLAADITLLVILARWLRGREAAVLRWYWCSPILFYITYLHGQLDALPIALLFAALYFLFRDRPRLAMLILGVALAAKTSVALAYPFVLVYLWRKRIKLAELLLLAVLPPAVFLLLNAGYLFTPGFTRIVLETREQFKIFDFSYRLGGGLTIYFVPLAFFFLFARSLTYRVFSRDLFLMFLGFAFGLLTLFIPPMQGWYFWIVPFFVYFYVKRDDAPRSMFWALNLLYLAYFLVIKQSDYFNIFQLVAPAFAQTPPLYFWLASLGIDADTAVNLVFTLLQSALLLNIVWLYRKGIESSVQYKIAYQPYLIGLAGDSGSGKSTLSALMTDKFGDENVLVVRGDDLHRWERGDENWKSHTHLQPQANRLHDEVRNAAALRGGRGILRRIYDHATGKFQEGGRFDAKKVVIFEGLHSLYLDKLRDLLDLKIFVRPQEDLRVRWKVERDMKERGYSREKVEEQLRARQEDSEKYIQTQSKHADIIVSFRSRADRELELDLAFGNDVDVHPLLAELAKSPTLTVRHEFDESRQQLSFAGHITAEEIDRAAFTLIPDLWDTVNRSPRWNEGYNGLFQLFVGYYVFSRMKHDAYGPRR